MGFILLYEPLPVFTYLLLILILTLTLLPLHLHLIQTTPLIPTILPLISLITPILLIPPILTINLLPLTTIAMSDPLFLLSLIIAPFDGVPMSHQQPSPKLIRLYELLIFFANGFE